MVPDRYEDCPVITLHVRGIHPGGHAGPSSGSHHEVTWLGLSPPDVSPVCREGGSGATPVASRTRRGNQDPPSMRGSMARRGLAWWGPGRRVQPKTQNQPPPPPRAPPLPCHPGSPHVAKWLHNPFSRKYMPHPESRRRLGSPGALTLALVWRREKVYMATLNLQNESWSAQLP